MDTSVRDLRRDGLLRLVSVFFVAVVVAVVLVLLAKAALSALMPAPDRMSIAQAFGLRPDLYGLVRPEPVESALFNLATVIGAIVAICAGWIAARRPLTFRPASIVLAAAAAASLAWVVTQIDWTSLLSKAPSPLVAAALAHPVVFPALALVAVAVALAVGLAPARAAVAAALAVGSALALAAASRTLVGTDDTYLWTTHNEVFVYPIIQDWLGAHLFVGDEPQKSQYGGFPIFLRWLWSFAEPTTGAISIVMSAIFLACTLAQIGFLVRFSRSPLIAIAFGTVAVLAPLLVFADFWPHHPYFQFFAVRSLFPALAMALVCWPPAWRRHGVWAYALLTPGLLWNFESGVVGLAMFGAFNLAVRFTGPAGSGALVLREGAKGLLGLAIGLVALTIYFVVSSGALPDVFAILDSSLSFSSGIAAIPMPAFGVWLLFALVYAASAYGAIHDLARGVDGFDRMRAAAMVAIAVCGTVWLKYYQGHSAAQQLNFVSFAAYACLGLLVDRALASRSRAVVSAVGAVVFAPVAAAFCLWLYSGAMYAERSLSVALHPDPKGWSVRAAGRIVEAFEQIRTDPSDRALVLAPYGYHVNQMLRQASPVHAAGACQIWFAKELAQVQRAVSDPATKLVYIDTELPCSRIPPDHPAIAEVLATEYERAFTPTGCVMRRLGEGAMFVRKGLNERLRLVSARQSSTRATSTACLAIDGNTDGRFERGSVSHTAKEEFPFWEIDLGRVQDISEIEIWNRTDGGDDRLKGFWTIVSNSPMATAARPETLKTEPGNVATFHAGPVGEKVTIPLKARGRYVRIQIEGEGVLTLAEVQVR